MTSPIVRRLVTVPALLLLFVVSWGTAPLLLPTAITVDAIRWLVARRPWMAIRLLAFLLAYTAAEAVGLVALGATWAFSAGGRLFGLTPVTFWIQRRWAEFVFLACRRVFGLRISADGLDAVAPAPFILLARHASIVDNLLPAWFISRPHRTLIRHVMKRELLIDPALDVAGNRLGNLFIRRGARAADSELTAIRRLAESLPDTGAILLYPEGTRFSEDKRDRSQALLARRRQGRLSPVPNFRHVVPPRLGGTLALLDGCAADVVVMAHRGLDGFAHITDIWQGAMVRRDVEVEFWRIPRAEIPVGRAARADWLFDLWSQVDRWVERPAVVPGSPR